MTKIIDYISGKEVAAGKEETEAVQPLSKILVEDLGYPKDNIRTRPQWRVKARPSDTRKEYPTDIAIFSSDSHLDSNLEIICECKSTEKSDGITQLEDYMRLSRAKIGVWYNGSERIVLLKNETSGTVSFREIPSIPKYGQRIEDIGKYKRSELTPTHNLKAVFSSIRNHLAANAVAITRDEIFAQQLINLIFCKIYDERFTKPSDMVSFRSGINEDKEIVGKRIRAIFEKVKAQYPDVIDNGETIFLDDDMITHIVNELQIYCLIESERDAIAEAFEIFIGPSLKGGQGQFFTPRNVVKLLVSMSGLEPSSRVIDPACGSGGFLVEALKELWKSIDLQGKQLSWPDEEVSQEKSRAAINNIRGIDKDLMLSKVAKAYLAILGDGRGGVFCENSLSKADNWQSLMKSSIGLETFDLVLTNPPFGKKLKVEDKELLASYSLGHKWKIDKTTKRYSKTTSLQDGQSPQILFVERCLDLLKDSGKLVVILPESMLCNPSHRFIIEYINSVGFISAVVSFPEELFQPFTHAKVCGVIIKKGQPTKDDENIFMAIAKWCGHDSRGLEIPYDDIPEISQNYFKFKEGSLTGYSSKGFSISRHEIANEIFLPKYYDPEIKAELESLRSSHDLLKMGDLISNNIVAISTGHEVGKLAYGTGNIPFVRTSDIANWEIKIDPKHGLSEEIYNRYKVKQDVRANDILMVRDGTYLVGTCAMVTNSTEKIVYQSHLYKMRISDPEKLNPHLLLASLSSPIVKKQMHSKRFTQDIIDTLGARIEELIIPIPKSTEVRSEIINDVISVFELKERSRNLSKRASLSVAGIDDMNDDFLTLKDY